MIKRLSFVVFILGALLLENSCKNDFNILAPYKDTTIVYCLLNPNDTVQYVRIHKAFVGEGNAYEFAQVADSFYYKDVLKVQIVRWYNNVPLDTIDCIRDSSTIVKDTGVFVNSPNILYKTIGNDSIYNAFDATTGEHYIYKLRIENLETGKIVTSETPVVSKIYVTSPQSNSLVDFTIDPAYIIEWYSAYFGKIYDVVVRFHYGEATVSNPFSFVEKTLDWRVGQKLSNNIGSSEKMQVSIGKTEFFVYVGGKLKADPNVIRNAGKVDFIFTAGADDFYTYYRVNGFPSGLSQTLPEYTNIKGGIGIFSSRYIQVVNGLDLDGNTKAELANGIYTKDLNF